jgi:hypothetical protein
MGWHGKTVNCSIHFIAWCADKGTDAFLTTVTKNSCKTWADVPKSSDSIKAIARFRFGSSFPVPVAA